MMRHRLLAAAVSFGLVGCTVHPGSLVSLPTTGNTVAPSGQTAPAGEQAQDPVNEYGTLSLTIRWPERPSGYQTALIPTSTNALTIQVKSGDTVVGETTVTREPNASTATAALPLKAANNLSVEVLAYRESAPLPENATPIARGTTNVNITRSRKTLANVSLVPLIVPTITALSTNTGVPGDTVTITGTNFGSGSIPVQVSFNGYLTVGVTRNSETSLTVQVPPGTPTGRVVVKADGVSSAADFVFWVPSSLGIDADKPGWDPSTDAAKRVVLLGKTRAFSASTTWAAKTGESVDQYGTAPAPTWASSNHAAGTIDAAGLFTAGDHYDATGTDITASYGSAVSSAIHAVPEDVSVALTPTDNLKVGGKGAASIGFRATNFFSDGATNSAVTFQSTQAASVSITPTGGLATALDFGNNGVIEVQALSGADPSRMATASVRLSNYVVTTLAGRASGNVDGVGTAAQFGNPRGMAVGPDGSVYVADTDNGSVRKVTPGGQVSTVATGLSSPWGIAVDSAGTLYVNSGNSIVKVQGSTQSTLAGTPYGRGLTDGFGAAASFNFIDGLAVDGNGKVYVCDGGNNAVRVVTPEGFVSTLAGDGTQGFRDGVGANARFNSPYGVAVDGSGNVFVADGQNYRIRKVAPDGTVTTVANGQTNPTGYFGYPFCIALDGDGNVFFTSDGEVRRVSPDGRVTLIAGGPWGASEDGVGTNARFSFSFGIGVASDGTVYVSDSSNYKIRKLQ